MITQPLNNVDHRAVVVIIVMVSGRRLRTSRARQIELELVPARALRLQDEACLADNRVVLVAGLEPRQSTRFRGHALAVDREDAASKRKEESAALLGVGRLEELVRVHKPPIHRCVRIIESGVAS
jgi:hypothetical protein